MIRFYNTLGSPAVTELDAIYAAFTFLSRLPLPQRPHHEAALEKAVVYFPLVGIVIGGLGYLAFALANMIWSTAIACAIAMLVMILATGGFHEDGLADSADGIGGGWTREDKLRIMKDSRIGTYGALALGLMLLLKFAALNSIGPQFMLAALLLAHAVSRWTILPMLRYCDYASGAGGSGNPLMAAVTRQRLTIITAALLVLMLWLDAAQTPAIIVLTLTLLLVSRWYLQRKLGGITGDTLGAINQLSELLIYLLFAAATHPAS